MISIRWKRISDSKWVEVSSRGTRYEVRRFGSGWSSMLAFWHQGGMQLPATIERHASARAAMKFCERRLAEHQKKEVEQNENAHAESDCVCYGADSSGNISDA